METRHASAERTAKEHILAMFKKLNEVPIIQELVNKSTDIMFVLDDNRQVVFTNQTFLDLVGAEDADSVLGKRPGEALSCVHSSEVSGCGTTEYCVRCGAVNTILNTQKTNQESREECLLNVTGGGAYELDVIARPFEYEGFKFTFFTAKNVSGHKRQQALEKIFFHDILNLASGIYSITDLINEKILEDIPKDMLSLLHQSSAEMIKEVNSYRVMAQAEKSELTVKPEETTSAQLVKTAADVYESYGTVKGVSLKIDENSKSIPMVTDKSLAGRVIGNMIKNALEATGKGGAVTIWAEEKNDKVLINVHNSSFIPDDIQKLIFKRSFTTKNTGTGLGTYSMRLLMNQYLEGSVDFVSEKNTGTVFTAVFPKKIQKTG